MRKKLLSILLSVCMVLTLLPTAAFATDTTYNVWVAGVQITDANKDEIRGDGISGIVTYDPAANTLTLDNATIVNTSYTSELGQNFAVAISADQSLNMVLIGESSVTESCTAVALSGSTGINTGGALNISGGGSLTVTSGNTGSSCAIAANGVSTIKNVEITAIAGEGNSSTAIYCNSALTIENSQLTAIGGNCSGEGGTSYGIEVSNNAPLTIKNGTVTASSGTAATSQAFKSAPTLTAYTGEKVILVGNDKNNTSQWDNSTGLTDYKYVKIAPPIPTAAEYATHAAPGTDYVVDDTATPKTLHIKTAKGAAWWIANYTDNDRDDAVYLDNDVDVSDFLWSPVGGSSSFTGTFDGQGHSISGLDIRVTAEGSDVAAAGLFRKTEGAVIKNTGLIGAAVVATATPYGSSYSTSAACSGAFAAEAANCTFTNCFASGSVAASGGVFSYAGGFVGSVVGGFVGSVVGGSNNSFTNCYNACSLSSTGGYGANYACGMIGVQSSDPTSIINCFSLENCATGTTTADLSGTSLSETLMKAAAGTTNALFDSLNGWVTTTASTDYYTWAADNGTTPINDGYPVFGPAWVAQAQWGTATGTNNDQPPAAGASVHSGSLTDAMTYANSLTSGTAYIQLLTNVDITATLEFAKNKTTVLDLNGKTLDADDIPTSSSDNNVLTVNGNLTLCDTSTATVAEQGKITGGHGAGDGTGGGVYINFSGTFIMTGGNITGNTAMNGGGVANEGTFTMTGGNITGNTVENGSAGPGMGGGVANLGIFNISGGGITDNTAVSGGSGGGIANFGTLTLSGSVNISGNTVGTASDNVALIYGTALNITAPLKLNISGALTNSTAIGVSTQEVTVDGDDNYLFTPNAGVFTGGTAVTNSDYISKFVSDNSGFAVIADGSQLKLAAAQAITKADATNGSFTVKVNNGNEVPSAIEGQTVTITPTANANYELDTITVTKTGDPNTTVTLTSGTFTMPAYAVTVNVTFKVGAELPSGGGTPTGGGSAAPTGAPVIVDGKTVNIGTEKKSGDTTTVTVDQSKLGTNIGGAASGSSVVVPVSENGSATASLVVKNIEDMAAKRMTLTVQTGIVAYNLNTSAIDTAALAAAFPGADMSTVPFNVTISNSAVSVEGETLVLSPVAFTVTVTYGGKTVDVDTFSTYIDRVIEVTAEQAAKITTAVVVNADSSFRHVPTT